MVDVEGACGQFLRKGVAVVTGASRGLGRALSVELTVQGVRVVGFGRDIQALEQTRQECVEGLFKGLVVDVSDFRAVDLAFNDIKQTAGDVTILINNAAVYPRVDFLRDNPELFMHAVRINLGGMVACAHASLRMMTNTGVGRIIEVGSYADLFPLPCSASYSVSKGATRVLTRALIADISDRFPDILFNTWLPGMLDTEMGVPEGLDPNIAAKWGACLGLWHDRSINGLIFERDREVVSARSLKSRLKDFALLKKVPRPRIIQVVSNSA